MADIGECLTTARKIKEGDFESWYEEWNMVAMKAVKRGYHVFSFEGPRQGSVLREQGLCFRADWEYVICY